MPIVRVDVPNGEVFTESPAFFVFTLLESGLEMYAYGTGMQSLVSLLMNVSGQHKSIFDTVDFEEFLDVDSPYTKIWSIVATEAGRLYETSFSQTRKWSSHAFDDLLDTYGIPVESNSLRRYCSP
jgi:hypothetical protein